ncbi:MAG: PilZ domain-containing protein [Pseudomonadota bacterium]
MGKERRRYDRVNTVLYATFSDGKRKFRDVIQNASAGGVMIETNEPWEVSTLLDMLIDARSSINVRGKVVWTAKHWGAYRIGIEFEDLGPGTASVWADVLMCFTDLWIQAGVDCKA